MHDPATEGRGPRHGWAQWCAAVAGVLLLTCVSPARALTTPECLAKKLDEWGKLRKCEAVEGARTLQGGRGEPAKCQARFDARLAILRALAGAAAVPCRYGVAGAGTVLDYDTGLEWERKTTDGTVHDRENVYDWGRTLGSPDGTVFTSFLRTLNDARSPDGTTSSGCFAGHCDWRLPSVEELRTIVDLTAPGCGDGGPCIDEDAFGPTIAFFYWSATVETDFPVFAWGVAFGADGRVSSAIEDGVLFARGVRAAL